MAGKPRYTFSNPCPECGEPHLANIDEMMTIYRDVLERCGISPESNRLYQDLQARADQRIADAVEQLKPDED